jgi:hypothetical protein
VLLLRDDVIGVGLLDHLFEVVKQIFGPHSGWCLEVLLKGKGPITEAAASFDDVAYVREDNPTSLRIVGVVLHLVAVEEGVEVLNHAPLRFVLFLGLVTFLRVDGRDPCLPHADRHLQACDVSELPEVLLVRDTGPHCPDRAPLFTCAPLVVRCDRLGELLLEGLRVELKPAISRLIVSHFRHVAPKLLRVFDAHLLSGAHRVVAFKLFDLEVLSSDELTHALDSIRLRARPILARGGFLAPQNEPHYDFVPGNGSLMTIFVPVPIAEAHTPDKVDFHAPLAVDRVVLHLVEMELDGHLRVVHRKGFESHAEVVSFAHHKRMFAEQNELHQELLYSEGAERVGFLCHQSHHDLLREVATLAPLDRDPAGVIEIADRIH